MQGKFVFGGEGAKVPGTDFGMSFALFKLWLRSGDGDWTGYTTASNQGLLGMSILETPIVDFSAADADVESAFAGLHGATVEVAISPNLFVKDGGIATIKIKRLSNDPGAAREISFYSDQCKGFSASVGDIHFTATLLQLPQEEQNPNGYAYVPW